MRPLYLAPGAKVIPDLRYILAGTTTECKGPLCLAEVRHFGRVPHYTRFWSWRTVMCATFWLACNVLSCNTGFLGIRLSSLSSWPQLSKSSESWEYLVYTTHGTYIQCTWNCVHNHVVICGIDARYLCAVPSWDPAFVAC